MANIYGGTVFYPQSVGSSLGGVPGGGATNIYGGNITYLAAQDTGIMDVFGTGLTETFLESSSPFLDYSVTGTLQDGTPLNVLYASNNGTLLFNGLPAVPLSAVPEASTTVSFGLLLALGLGSIIVARKKRQALISFSLYLSARAVPRFLKRDQDIFMRFLSLRCLLLSSSSASNSAAWLW